MLLVVSTAPFRFLTNFSQLPCVPPWTGRRPCRKVHRSRSSLWNQEMECRCHVVMGHLRRHGMLYVIFVFSGGTCCRCTILHIHPAYPMCFVSFLSAPFAETRWTSPRSNTKPIHLPPTTTVFPLPLETADTSFTWTASSAGWKLDLYARFATKNGTLPKLNAFRGTVNWEFRISIGLSTYWGRPWSLILGHHLSDNNRDFHFCYKRSLQLDRVVLDWYIGNTCGILEGMCYHACSDLCRYYIRVDRYFNHVILKSNLYQDLM